MEQTRIETHARHFNNCHGAMVVSEGSYSLPIGRWPASRYNNKQTALCKYRGPL